MHITLRSPEGRLHAFARFVLVGGAGFIIDAGMNQLLIHAGVAPLWSRPPAIAVAMVFTWQANRTITFRASGGSVAGEAARYAAVAVAMALFNYLLYGALVLAGMAPLAAVLGATAVHMVFSFFGYRRFAFGGAAREKP